MKPNLSLKPSLKQKLSPILKETLHILQMPFSELQNYLVNLSDQNPCIKVKSIVEQREVVQQDSLFEHLMKQARIELSSSEELKIAENIIGNLNESGFYPYPLQSELEKRILKIIQTFDPPGIAFPSLKEWLLAQLKENEPSYLLIKKHFDLLLKGKGAFLKRKFPDAFKKLFHLNFQPNIKFQRTQNYPIIPDITIQEEGDKYNIRVKSEELLITPLPYFIKEARQIKFACENRKKLLKKITILLLKRGAFSKQMAPVTIKEMAEELNISYSTAARAVSDKYVECPIGIVPLRSFFSSAIKTASGEEMSKKKVCCLLKELIKKETKPLSDLNLVRELEKKGIFCKRRTITKYRKKLSILASHKRFLMKK